MTRDVRRCDAGCKQTTRGRRSRGDHAATSDRGGNSPLSRTGPSTRSPTCSPSTSSKGGGRVAADGPLRWAVYARKSTDHQDASTDVQVAEARRWVAARGGAVEPDHVFVDDAVSRAEFKHRPALFAMLDAAKRRAFDGVVVRDETRLGGDMLRTGLLMQDLVEAGVRLFHYVDGEEVRFDDPTSRLIATIRNYGAELEREKTASRTHEHLLLKARAGANAGGRCYGYDNVPVEGAGADGSTRKLRTEYRINAREAAVVRRIFGLYSEGWGLKRIARQLNRDRVPSPRAGKRGTGSWSPSSLHAMLRNERYRGVVPYDRTKKTYRGGTKVRVERPREEWVRASAPHLRIVDEALWVAATDARRSGSVARLRGRPPVHLLSGIMRCGVCGGPIQVGTTKQSYETVRAYVCAWHKQRGPEVCGNGRYRPMDAVDEEVARVLLARLSDADLVDELVRRTEAKVAAAARAPKRAAARLAAEEARLAAELRRLSDAVASGAGEVPALVGAMRERQASLDAVRAQLAAGRRGETRGESTARKLTAEIRERLGELAALFRRRTADARRVLQHVFPDGLTATPFVDESGSRRWRIEGEAVFAASDRGLPKGASPAGFEPAYPA